MTKWQAKQVAKKIAEAIESDICDRRGLKHEFRAIDVETQGEIRREWVKLAADIILDHVPHD